MPIPVSEEDYYDIILIDVHMPGKSGIEAIREIRNMERKDSGMPVIVMTADILDERVLGELSAAVSGCLVKPYIAYFFPERNVFPAFQRPENRS